MDEYYTAENGQKFANIVLAEDMLTLKREWELIGFDVYEWSEKVEEKEWQWISIGKTVDLREDKWKWVFAYMLVNGYWVLVNGDFDLPADEAIKYHNWRGLLGKGTKWKEEFGWKEGQDE
jgi:hypothetical protein